MASTYIILLFSLTKIINGKQEGFIVRGKDAKNIDDFSYCAALFINDGIRCGSSILTQSILITAAHCLEEAHTLIANVGSLDRDDGVKRVVAKCFRHQKYSEATVENDIGLCKLKIPLKLGDHVKRVVLLREPPIVKEGLVAGWGLIDEYTEADSPNLKYTKQRLWSYPECKGVMNTLLPQGTICGGDMMDESGFASAGDSGGALVVQKLIQVGLVSFKVTAISDSLVAYTDVSHFYDWIQRTANELSCI